jgi:hypothetical protein
MAQVEILDTAHHGRHGYKVDVNRGERIDRVSSEWFSRPADECCRSLSDLLASVHARTERSRTRTVESAASRVEARAGITLAPFQCRGAESQGYLTYT